MIAYIKKLHKPIYIKQQPYGTIFYMFSFARSFIFRQKFSPPPSPHCVLKWVLRGHHKEVKIEIKIRAEFYQILVVF